MEISEKEQKDLIDSLVSEGYFTKDDSVHYDSDRVLSSKCVFSYNLILNDELIKYTSYSNICFITKVSEVEFKNILLSELDRFKIYIDGKLFNSRSNINEVKKQYSQDNLKGILKKSSIAKSKLYYKLAIDNLNKKQDFLDNL